MRAKGRFEALRAGSALCPQRLAGAKAANNHQAQTSGSCSFRLAQTVTSENWAAICSAKASKAEAFAGIVPHEHGTQPAGLRFEGRVDFAGHKSLGGLFGSG